MWSVAEEEALKSAHAKAVSVDECDPLVIVALAFTRALGGPAEKEPDVVEYRGQDVTREPLQEDGGQQKDTIIDNDRKTEKAKAYRMEVSVDFDNPYSIDENGAEKPQNFRKIIEAPTAVPNVAPNVETTTAASNGASTTQRQTRATAKVIYAIPAVSKTIIGKTVLNSFMSKRR